MSLQVGGSLSWAKPKHSGVNKRFLNKTMMSTLIQNNIVTKHKTSSQEKQSTSKLLKESPALNKAASSDQGETRQGSGDKEERSNKSNKIVISNKSRLNAYIKGKRVKQATATNTEGK